MTDSIHGSDHPLDIVTEALHHDVKLCLDVAGVLLIARNKEGIVTTINKRGIEILGYDEEEIVGESWFDFVAREEREESRRIFADILEERSGFVEYYERTVITKNGEKRTLLLHNALIRDAAGVLVGLISSGEDVTNQKKLSESLAKEERLNEVVADNLPIGYCVNTISDGRVTFMNKKFEEIYGWPREIVNSVDVFFERVYPDPEFRKKIKEQVLVDIMSANPARMIWKNLPIVKQSGETGYITAQNIPLYEYDLMISTVIDVTRQVTIEQALRESGRLVRALLDNVPDPAWMKDKNGAYLAVNNAFLAQVNKRRDEVIGKTDLDVWAKEYADKYHDDDEKVIKSRIQHHIEETTLDSSGNVVWVETIKTPVYDDAGVLLGVTGVSHIIAEPSA